MNELSFLYQVLNFLRLTDKKATILQKILSPCRFKEITWDVQKQNLSYV